MEDRKIILDNLSGPNLIAWALSSELSDWRQERAAAYDEVGEILSMRRIQCAITDSEM